MSRSCRGFAPRKFGCRLVPIFRWVALALLSCVPAACQNDSLQQTPSAEQASNFGDAGRYTLSGTVVNSVSGEAVPRALVEIPGTGRAMLTGLDGRFEFDDLPQMQATLDARKPGFFTELELNQGVLAPAPNQVETGPQTPPVVLKLTPQSVILGRIEVNGSPVEGLAVRVLAAQILQGHKRLVQRGTAVSNEEGEFRVSGLLPGTYYVEAGPGLEFGEGLDSEAEENGGKPPAGEEGYSQMFYPGVPEISAATPIDLAPGDQAVADLAVKSVPVVRISGVVAGSNAHGWLQLESDSQENLSLPMRFDQQTGKFQIKAPAGVYRLRATDTGPNGETWTADTPLDASKDISGLHLVLAPQSGIPVDVSLQSSGTSVPRTPGFAIIQGGRRINATSPPVNVHLIPLGTSAGGQDYFSSPTPGSDALAIRDVQPGTYAAEFTSSPPWHVDSAVCGDIDLMSDNLTISPGAPTPPIQIVLRDDSATLRGTISSEGEPVTAAVVLVPQRAPRQPAVTVDYAGNEFQFANLAPGDYSVFAVNRVDGLEYANPEVLQPYLSKATRVTLQPNGKAKIDLEVLPAGN